MRMVSRCAGRHGMISRGPHDGSVDGDRGVQLTVTRDRAVTAHKHAHGVAGAQISGDPEV